MTSDSPHDYPDDVELGLEPVDPEPATEPCGCAIYPGEAHDVDQCLQEQADALAEAEVTRRESQRQDALYRAARRQYDAP